MTLNTTSDLPVSPGTAAAAPSPSLLTSAQLMAALGINRRMLKNWNRDRLIPSSGVRHARRYDLEQVMEALRTHGQPTSAAASAAAAASSATPGLGVHAGMPADCEYHVLPR